MVLETQRPHSTCWVNVSAVLARSFGLNLHYHHLRHAPKNILTTLRYPKGAEFICSWSTAVSFPGRSALKANFCIRNLPLAKERRHRIPRVSVVSQTSAIPAGNFGILTVYSLFRFLDNLKSQLGSRELPFGEGSGNETGILTGRS